MIQFNFARHSALLLALAIPSAPVLASPATAASDQTETEEASDPNRMVCKRVEVIGSRLSTKRECKTAKQWHDEMAADRRDLDKIQTTRWKGA